jgi:hypothetical protein
MDADRSGSAFSSEEDVGPVRVGFQHEFVADVDGVLHSALHALYDSLEILQWGAKWDRTFRADDAHARFHRVASCCGHLNQAAVGQSTTPLHPS